MRPTPQRTPVSEDLTLDAFATEGEATGEASADEGSTDGDGEDRAVPPSAVTAAIPTSTYDPAGAACAGCGATVERRFRASGGYRCRSCISWGDDIGD
jgi:hypothetical protein